VLSLLVIALNVDVSNATPTSEFGNEKATLFNDADHSQSFCNHFEAMAKVTAENGAVGVNIGQALNGAHLNVIIYVEEELGYFNYDKNEGIDRLHPGFFANVLDYIAEEGNITWRTSFGTINVESNNSTFLELLQWGTDNYDIVSIFVSYAISLHFVPSPEHHIVSFFTLSLSLSLSLKYKNKHTYAHALHLQFLGDFARSHERRSVGT
jgi:hypothetical protein